MSVMQQSTALENKELMTLYGERNHYQDKDCEECDLDSDCSEEGKGNKGIRSSLSLEIYGLHREQTEHQVYFTNQEYYRRLEELKSTHLRNMAELEKMYISQSMEKHGREDDRRRRSTETGHSFSDGGPSRRLQRINSQEELDLHETSSGSDQSELCGEERVEELEMDKPQRSHGQDCTFGRMLLSPEEMTNQKQFWFQPKTRCLKPEGALSRPHGVKVKANSKVTVPKPFQMMLREEERKRHKVRTRSEVELENTLLKQELEELRECQKQFRASPAPAHIHLPLFDVISRRFRQRPIQSKEYHNRGNAGKRDPNSSRASLTRSPQPFHFLERERRKREAKIVADLENLYPKEEPYTFRARPMPRSVYGPRSVEDLKASCVQLQEREATEGESEPNSDLEAEVFKPDATAPEGNLHGPSRCPSSKAVKKQIEVSIEMVQDREWAYMESPKAPTCNLCSSQQRPC
ncbi:protein FAM161A [Sphaeramia orbicularis]|uniref:protein FAM161A n=1 Tax=Sphaeramia orbicularis TaxID=375764 RepID=UPI00117D37B1|nr:protein FAM161A-like [Sphaeramia orbicularis]